MNRLNVLLLLVLALVVPALASCSSMQIRVPKEVKVQVPMPCVDPAKRPKLPAVVDDDALMAMDRGTRTLRVEADRNKLIAYAGEAEAVIEACSRIPQGTVNSTGGPPMQTP